MCSPPPVFYGGPNAWDNLRATPKPEEKVSQPFFLARSIWRIDCPDGGGHSVRPASQKTSTRTSHQNTLYQRWGGALKTRKCSLSVHSQSSTGMMKEMTVVAAAVHLTRSGFQNNARESVAVRPSERTLALCLGRKLPRLFLGFFLELLDSQWSRIFVCVLVLVI